MSAPLSRDPRFRRDHESRTVSYYCTEDAIAVDDAMVDAMCIESASWGRRSVRLCLHGDPKDAYHEMVVLEREGHWFPPHCHVGKAETLLIIEGELGVLKFDAAGNVVFSAVLGRDGCFAASLAPGSWHLTLPMSDPVIYHESKPGPFMGEMDRAFAPWAPARNDTEGGKRYLEDIRRKLDEPAATG